MFGESNLEILFLLHTKENSLLGYPQYPSFPTRPEFQFSTSLGLTPTEHTTESQLSWGHGKETRCR